MKKLLLSGFGPFHTHKSNSTFEVTNLLDGTIIGPFEVTGVILPVVFEEVFPTLKESIEENSPDVIVLTGMAWGRDELSLERIAINLIDSERKDNNGVQYTEKKISESGENAFFSTLPLQKIKSTLDQLDIKVGLSNTAGTYVCNQIMYQCLEYLKSEDQKIPAGFIHLPPDKTLKSESSWDIQDLSKAMEELIKTLKY